MVTCSDSRVAINLFASTDPGDVFVIRNVGNIIPCCNDHSPGKAEGAAIEFSVSQLGVRDIIICGHSECGAMFGLLGDSAALPRHVKAWLEHAGASLARMKKGEVTDSELSPVNQLSQLKRMLYQEN